MGVWSWNWLLWRVFLWIGALGKRLASPRHSFRSSPLRVPQQSVRQIATTSITPELSAASIMEGWQEASLLAGDPASVEDSMVEVSTAAEA